MHAADGASTRSGKAPRGEEGPLSLHYGCRHGHQNFGGEWKMLPLPDKQWFVYDSEGKRFGAYMGKHLANNTLQNQTEKTEIDPAIDAVADGYALTADTIEELAALMEVPSGEFGSIWAAKYQGSGNITECMVFGRIAARELIAKK